MQLGREHVSFPHVHEVHDVHDVHEVHDPPYINIFQRAQRTPRSLEPLISAAYKRSGEAQRAPQCAPRAPLPLALKIQVVKEH
jgi:hypothetical protein